MSELQSIGIVASAGTGKTYQLAQRFLALLALGEGRRRIGAEAMVALTFTRKAAREFAGRILETLAKAASGEKEAAELGQRLVAVWNGTVEDSAFGRLPALVEGGLERAAPSREDFRRMLGEVADRLDQLQLTTLDSFFSRVARGFALELGMAGFELLDDAGRSRARAEVLGALFARGAEARGREAMAAALQRAQLGREETAWGRKIDQWLQDYEEEWLKRPELAAWGGLEPEGAGLTEPKVAERVRRVRQIERRIGFDGDLTDSQWKDDIASLLTLLEWLEGDLSGGPPGTKAATLALENRAALREGRFEISHGKRSARLEPATAQALAELLDHAQVRMTRTIAERTLGLGEVLDHYDAAYAARVRRRGELGFAELGALLAGTGVMREGVAVEREMRFDLEARLDAKIEHWFLDEFQDTSRVQWRVLQRWLDEVVPVLDGDRSLFVVGDPKQAIYGWRGGDAALFGELWQLPGWDQRLRRWGMSRSFRSSAPVLAFVNAVCDPAALADIEGTTEALRARWQFAPHESAARYGGGHPLAGEPLDGYAALWEVPKKAKAAAGDEESSRSVGRGSEDGDGNDSALGAGDETAVIDLEEPRWLTIARIIEEAGVAERGLSAVVLVRRVKTARSAGESLRRLFHRRGLALAVEIEGSAELATGSALGLALADAFLWLDQPGDRLAREHLRGGILGAGLARLGEAGNDAWGALWRLWSEGGPVAVIEALVAPLGGGALGEFQLGRLEAWLECARAWMQAGGGSLADWRRVVEHARQPEQARGGSVAIMTVHKAKGLEWDLVIYAEPGGQHLAWAEPKRRKLLAGEDRGRPFVMSRPPSWLVERDPRLKRAAQAWEDDQVYEGLCTGYVALTRARHALHVLVEPLAQSFTGPKRRGDHWIRLGLGCLEPASAAVETGTLLKDFGDPRWFARLPRAGLEARSGEVEPAVLGPAVPRLRRRLPSARAGEEAGGERRGGLVGGDATRHGSLLHAEAARLPLAGRGTVPDFGESRPAAEGAGGLQAEVRQVLAAAWADPALDWAWGEAGWELWTERGFEIVLDGEWISGVFDRVLLRRDGNGRVIEARLVEIKTDGVASGAELRARHRGQLQTYRQVLARLAGMAVERIDARWLWLARGKGGRLVGE